MSSNIAFSSAVEDVGAGRRDDRAKPTATELFGAGLRRAASIGEPRRQVASTRCPARVSAVRSHSAGSAGLSLFTWKLDFGLPGGLTSAAMCPLVDRTKREVPPSRCVVR